MYFFLGIIQWAGSTEYFLFSVQMVSVMFVGESMCHIYSVFECFQRWWVHSTTSLQSLLQCWTTLSVIKFFLVFNLSNKKQRKQSWNKYDFKFVKWVSIRVFSNMLVGGDTHKPGWARHHPLYPPVVTNPSCFQKSSRARDAVKRWRQQSIIDTHKLAGVLSQQWSLWFKGKEQQHLSPISVFWCFPPSFQQFPFSAALPLQGFCWQNRMLVANTLFIVIECIVIMLYSFFSFLKLNLFAIRKNVKFGTLVDC